MAVYVKAALAGLLAAIVAPILWILVRVGLVLVVSRTELARQPQGSGGIGAVSVGLAELEVLLPMLVGFALAFIVVMRRSRRERANSQFLMWICKLGAKR